MLGPKVALVLRAKAGSNFLIQTHGIPGKVAQDAVADVLEALGQYSNKDGATAGLRDGSGDAAPNFALGQMSALQGRYLVTYRMVNAILVLLVSEPLTNAFLCLRTLDATAKILVGACKGVEVTPERLSKRYEEVHALLGDIVAGGIASIPPGFIHTSATDERLLAVPLSPSDAARRLRKLRAGGKTSNFKAEKQGGSNDPTPPPVPETPTKRDGDHHIGADIGDPLGAVEFGIPADALPPMPARAMGARRRPPAPPVVVPLAAPTVFKGAVQDDAENQPPPEGEGFGAFGKVELMEAEKTEAEAAPSGEWEAEFGQEARPSTPTVTVDDLRESLQLVEIWRGDVVGGVLQKAGIQGEVRRRLAPYGLSTAGFRVLPSSSLVVNACLQTAGRSKAHCTPVDGDYGLVATLSGAPMDATYLKYSLPSSACDPPLQLDLAVAPQSEAPAPGQPSRGSWGGLIVLRYSVNPACPGPLLDVVADVDLPPEFSQIMKVSPAAQWSPAECRLRWTLGKLEPGESGCLRAVVVAKQSATAARALENLNSGTEGKVVFTVWPGKALSGVGFEVALPGDNEAEYYRGKAVSFGEVTLRP